MDKAAVDACLADQAEQDERSLNRRQEASAKFGVESTPSIVVNGTQAEQRRRLTSS